MLMLAEQANFESSPSIIGVAFVDAAVMVNDGWLLLPGLDWFSVFYFYLIQEIETPQTILIYKCFFIKLSKLGNT